ncbi:monocarboxylate transporter 13-like [Babylonia areolata]|uniref:monocarboxylate transporter 13-like n=1 Tax=Babylonia areolata TaxID=304850 RepID=UPI003FD4079C
MGLESSRGAFLVAVGGFGGLCGCLLSGLLVQCIPCLVLPVNHVSLILAGAATCLTPVFTEYYVIIMLSVVFGVFIGMFETVQPLVLIQLVGNEWLTDAIGLVCMYHGIGILIGLPLTGYVVDVTGDLNNVFFIGGATIAAAGFICLCLQCSFFNESHQRLSREVGNL